MDASGISAHNKDFFDDFIVNGRPAAHVSIPELLETNLRAGQFLSSMQQQQPMQNGVNLDVLEGLMAMQDNRAGQSNALASPTQPQPTPQMLMEHQMRLNQLQQLYQLQTQIFQQQIELLSGQSSLMPMMMDRTREQQQYLPTPAASAEIPPQPSPGFVPPMLLQNPDANVNNSQNAHQNAEQQQQQQFIPHHMIPPAPHSAPANIVFQNIQSPYPVPPADLDFDEMSPLTSPWLGAYNTGQASDMPGPSRGMQQQQHPSSNATAQKRRTVSPSCEDHNPAGRPSRKRQAHAGRLTIPQNTVAPSIPSMDRTRRGSLRGGTKSASSTPLFPPIGSAGTMTPTSNRSSRSGPSRGAMTPNEIPGDTPSPVDLSMPPPAAPQPQTPLSFVGSVEHTPAPTPMPPQGLITPVTPASIMNLGRLGTDSSLTPPNADPNAAQAGNKGKAKNTPRPRSASRSAAALISPALKPIRPAAGASGPSSGAASPSGVGANAGAGAGQPPLQVRKTSHKAAEQKRRDSLKTSFDDLRVLLPPIPLPSEDGFPDEPILPGAMPPRGPPKGNADGPNRGVSKLQLLRCGNDYIRRLKGRVERRDDEIETLRNEIRRLRLVVGVEAVQEGEEPVDLEKDLDAVEATLGPLGRSAALADEGGDDEDGGD